MLTTKISSRSCSAPGRIDDPQAVGPLLVRIDLVGNSIQERPAQAQSYGSNAFCRTSAVRQSGMRTKSVIRSKATSFTAGNSTKLTTRRRGALPRQARLTIKFGWSLVGRNSSELCRELRRQLRRPFRSLSSRPAGFRQGSRHSLD